MVGNIKVKIQTNIMISIQQGDSTVRIHPLKMRGFIQDLGLANAGAMQLKPEKIWIDELSYRLEKLNTEALMEVLSKAITEEINLYPIFSDTKMSIFEWAFVLYAVT